MSSGGDQTIGFRYYFDIHMGIGRGPVDQLVAIKVADRIAWQGMQTETGTGTIDAPELFGGDGKEGGIEGEFHLLMGEPDQVPPDGVKALQPEGAVAGFRRMCTLFYSGLVCSINPYPKAWSMRVRRAVKGWDGEVFRPDLAVIWMGGDDTAGASSDKVFDKLDFKAGATGSPRAVRFAPGGKFFAISDPDHVNAEASTLLYIYKPDAGPANFYAPLTGRGDGSYDRHAQIMAHDASFSPDGNYLVTGGGTGIRIFFGTELMQPLEEWVSPLIPADVNGVHFHPNSRNFLAGNNTGLYYYTLHVNRWYAGNVIPGTAGVRRVKFHPSGRYFVTACTSQTLMLHGTNASDTGVFPLLNVADKPVGVPNDLAWSYDGKFLACVHDAAPFLTIYSFDVDAGVLTKLPDVAEPPAGAGKGVTWRPSGTHLAVAHTGTPFVSIYDVSGDQFTKRPPLANPPPGNGTAIEWNPSGDALAVGHENAPGKEKVTFYGRSRASGSQFTSDTNIMAMNPAHIIYECLTNREWGRGLPRDVIDGPAFERAAQTLYDERFGLCLKWARRDSIQTFVQSVLDHINATIYSDRETALLTIKLIRGDYDRHTLPLYDVFNGILEIRESTTTTISAAVNEVVVTYRDPINNEDKTVRAQNLATLQSTGGSFLSMAKPYPGVPTAALAVRLAQRDLRANAEGLRRFTLLMNRSAWKIAPGDVIRIQDVSRNVPDMVVRVARIEDGNASNGAISLTVVQDVFTLPKTSFVEQQPNTWEPPNFQPCIGRHQVIEAPYFLLSRLLPRGDVNAIDASSAYLGTVVEQGQATNTNYDIFVRNGLSDSSDDAINNQAFCGYQP